MRGIREKIALNHSEPVPSADYSLRACCHHGAIPQWHVPVRSSVRLALLGSAHGFTHNGGSVPGHGPHQHPRNNQFHPTVAHPYQHVNAHGASKSPIATALGIAQPFLCGPCVEGSVGDEGGLQQVEEVFGGWGGSVVGRGTRQDGEAGAGLGPSWEAQLSPSWIASPRCRVVHKTQPWRLQPLFSSLGALGGGQQREELAGPPQGSGQGSRWEDVVLRLGPSTGCKRVGGNLREKDVGSNSPCTGKGGEFRIYLHPSFSCCFEPYPGGAVVLFPSPAPRRTQVSRADVAALRKKGAFTSKSVWWLKQRY